VNPAGLVPLVEVLRGGLVESLHLGAVAVAAPDGEILHAAGDPGVPVVLRSAAKPFQAASVVASGAAEARGMTAEELAVAAGSHGGRPEQVRVVRRLLERADLDEGALRCGRATPLDRDARLLARASGGPEPVQHPCSGKHAAMLLACRHLGLDEGTYPAPDHPWQRRVHEDLARWAGLPPGQVAAVPDGCGVPSFVLPLAAAARALARLATGEDPALAAVFRAVTAHPALHAGPGRLGTALMELRPGMVLAKSGTEGVYALAIAPPVGPLGAVLKVADGNDRRARPAAAIALARGTLALTPGETARLVRDHVPRPVTTTGRPAGDVRPREGAFPRPAGPVPEEEP